MDRKDTQSSEEEDDNREELERLESDVFEEEVRKEVRGMHESGKEESEGEGETDDRIKEKARVYHEHYIQYVHIHRYIVAA